MKMTVKLSAVVLSLFVLNSCKTSHSTSTPAPTTGSADTLNATISTSVPVNVYPGIASGGSGRIYIKTAQVGNVQVALPMLFDTGSAGVTLNALSIFPSTVVDNNGFKFKTGQDTIQYNGITITKINAQKVFGSANIETRQLGNIGYAKLTIGDAAGQVKTLRLPILFYYQTLQQGVPVTGGLGSVFGVNTSNNAVQGLIDTTLSFQLISPLKYLIYTNNTIAGFKLNAVTLNSCDINTTGSCMPQLALTVGVTKTDEAAYGLNQLIAASPQPVLNSPQGYPAYPGFTTYNAVITNSVISTTGKSRTSSVLLDSGNPGVIFPFPKDSINAANYPVITLTTPSKSSYTYNYATASFNTVFNPSGPRSVYGIYFFTNFNFLEDYQSGLLGLKVK